MKGTNLAIAAVAVIFLGASVVYPVYAGGPAFDSNRASAGSYQQDTADLHGDLAARQQDLRQEYGRETPDLARIAILQEEIRELRTQIHNADYAYSPGGMRGYGHDMYRHGMMGRGGYCGTCGCW